MKKLFAEWSHIEIDEVFKRLKTSEQGLSPAEVAQSLQDHGSNELIGHTVGWWDVLRRQLTSPFSFILAAVIVISFVLGEYIDGLMVLLFFVINSSLSFFQEYRSEKSVQVLRQFITTKTHVIRSGKEELIESRCIVPGDIVIVEAGDIVPADIRLIDVINCTIDESSLTGESIAVQKEVTVRKTSDFFSAQNIAFSGTHVLSGRASGVAFATGRDSQIGEIAQLTDQSKHVSGFEQSIAAYSEVILRIIFFTLLIVIALNIFLKFHTVDLYSLLFFSIALAISVIPEGLPVVTTLALSQGALSLAKLKVVVKRLSAIEDLGSIEYLCTDKTGTLTQNSLTVTQVFSEEKTKNELIYVSVLGASFLGLEKKEPNNSFDIALWNELSESERKKSMTTQFGIVMPFDPIRKRSTVVVKSKEKYLIITRGAPELLISLAALSPTKQEEYLKWAQEQGRDGKRVLAIVSKILTTEPKVLTGNNDLKNARFEGIIAFEDPLKKSAINALKQAKILGVQVKILTGDSLEVSTHVAKQTGLIQSDDQVISGEQLEALPLSQQHEAVVAHHVFARVTPEQKHTIIQLLEEKASVGFLGEGINDAPALKSAHVGIVVQGASDIAVQAADVVLLANDLEVVIEGVQKGREIFTNTVKYIKATLASNFGNFFAVAVASLISTSLPMLPLQILLLNLLSDFPMLSIATDTVDPNELKRPKSYRVSEVVALATVLGVVSSFFDFTFFAVFSRQDPANLQTYWFMGSVLTELAFMFSIRVRGFFLKSVPPSFLMVVFALFAAAMSVVLPMSAFGQRVFLFIRPNLSSIGVVMLIVSVYFIVSESVKLAYYKYIRQTEAGEPIRNKRLSIEGE